jgi:hypothetical protein
MYILFQKLTEKSGNSTPRKVSFRSASLAVLAHKNHQPIQNGHLLKYMRF